MRTLLVLSLVLRRIKAETSPNNTGDQLQAFTFGYTTSNLALPVTYTCPSPLLITGLDPTNAGGPDPSAPYTMVAFVHEQLEDGAGVRYERMYARTMDVGDMSQERTFGHPWGEGTQFIGCIWSANGVSGGCQDLVTVVPSPNLTASAYANAEAQCRVPDVMGSWVTDPSNTLDVTVEGVSGQVAQNGWPASCSDLKFTPKNGTGPFTLVVAPAMHPPVNISSAGSGSSDNSMNYTIRLTHGQAFMAGVFDSVGNSFAFGPLHAGHSDKLSCLAVMTGQKTPGGKEEIGVGALAGGVVGGFVVGVLGALLLGWLLTRRKAKPARRNSQELLDPYAQPRPASYRAHSGTSSTFGKPLASGGYTDYTPPVGFDSPATLYDPAPGSHGVAYPAPPGAHDDHRPFPLPPDPDFYPVPFDNRHSRQSYQSDFSPPWREGARNSLDRTISAEGQRDSLQSTAASRGRPQSGESSTGRGKMGRLHAVGGPASPRDRDRSMLGDGEEEAEEYDSQGRRARNVYVVHSDGGGGDVHIRLPDGRANVIELPPNYQPDPRSPPQSGSSPVPSGRTIPTSNQGAIATSAPAPTSPTYPPNNFSPPPAPGAPGSIRSIQSIDSKPDIPIPYLDLPNSPSFGSGFSDMTDEELRARAEAALAEKSRPLSAASGVVAPSTALRQEQESPERRKGGGEGRDGTDGRGGRPGSRISSGGSGFGPLGPSGPRPAPRR